MTVRLPTLALAALAAALCALCHATADGTAKYTRIARYQPLDIEGQVVLVTGASSGIGAATARAFAEMGCKLVLVARRLDRLNALKDEFKAAYLTESHVVSLDVADMAAIKDLPNTLPDGFKQVDILVNNAGLALGTNKAQANDIDDIQTMLTVNVAALMALTRVFTPGMIARARGHLINIGSIAGHEAYGGGSVYCATKHAVDAFTKSARHDMNDTPVRVTAISPGAVNTEFSTVRLGDKSKADAMYDGFDPLLAVDIADNVVYAATRPLNVQIADIIVLANAQSSAKSIAKKLA